MCGINGLVYHDRTRAVSPDVLKKMCDTMVHRGPDDEGFFIDGGVGLGMRRLSVIDLAGGHQPISNEDGQVWIVFNGEIYNFPQLRGELEAKGHEFATNTDTETIVHAYEEYGPDCVKKLNGMFSFAIWDQRRRRLMLARDRVGIKPLYYYSDHNCLAFGSELKALLQCAEVPRDLDHLALDTYLTCEYIPGPRTIFKNVHKLPPGHVLILEDGQTTVESYWDIHYEVNAGTEAELGQHLYDLLKDAVRMRLISDVPLGAFLSGGIDSSAIVCMMSELMDRPVQTFSIGFDDPSYNELGYARQVAQHFGADHHDLVIQPDIVDLVEGLVGFLDEPLADVSIFPTYLVSKLAREKVTVVLSGDGGDELFAGYDWYVADRIEQYYRRLPSVLRNRLIPRLVAQLPPTSQKKGAVNKLKRFVEGSVLPQELRQYRWNTFLPEEHRGLLYSRDFLASLENSNAYSSFTGYLGSFKAADPLWQAQYADIKTYLVDDILTKVDRMSMAHSLEARVPFLDHRVVEFASGLPSGLKLKGMKTKYLLKQAMAGKLPREVLTRKKEGFSIPIKNWLKEELQPMMREVLAPDRLDREGIFNSAWVERLKSEHVQGSANHSHQLWALMVFEIWRDQYLKS
jgi:asparagine synthase (glutamine-hydrolysing)